MIIRFVSRHVNRAVGLITLPVSGQVYRVSKYLSVIISRLIQFLSDKMASENTSAMALIGDESSETCNLE